MTMVGICSICGAPATSTCRMCGKLFCSRCIDRESGVCVRCHHKKETALDDVPSFTG